MLRDMPNDGPVCRNSLLQWRERYRADHNDETNRIAAWLREGSASPDRSHGRRTPHITRRAR
jgi:hypothetical protein